MSDEARRTLARQAGDGDLNAAIDLVLTIMRGTPPIDPTSIPLETCVVNVVNNAGIPLGHHAFDRPATGEQLRARPRISFNEVMFSGRWKVTVGNFVPPDPRDTLVRWLVAHTGKVISLCQDPPSLEAVEPSEHVKYLTTGMEFYRAKWAFYLDKKTAESTDQGVDPAAEKD